MMKGAWKRLFSTSAGIAITATLAVVIVFAALLLLGTVSPAVLVTDEGTVPSTEPPEALTVTMDNLDSSVDAILAQVAANLSPQEAAGLKQQLTARLQQLLAISETGELVIPLADLKAVSDTMAGVETPPGQAKKLALTLTELAAAGLGGELQDLALSGKLSPADLEKLLHDLRDMVYGQETEPTGQPAQVQATNGYAVRNAIREALASGARGEKLAAQIRQRVQEQLKAAAGGKAGDGQEVQDRQQDQDGNQVEDQDRNQDRTQDQDRDRDRTHQSTHGNGGSNGNGNSSGSGAGSGGSGAGGSSSQGASGKGGK